MRLRQRIVATVATAVMVTAGGTMIGATPAAAAGGGCKNGGTNGWNVASCISTAGGSLLPDLYVNWAGNPSFCTIKVTVQRGDNYSERDVANYPCQAGHYGPVGKSMTPGFRYRTVVRPSNSEPVYSPWVWI